VGHLSPDPPFPRLLNSSNTATPFPCLEVRVNRLQQLKEAESQLCAVVPRDTMSAGDEWSATSVPRKRLSLHDVLNSSLICTPQMVRRDDGHRDRLSANELSSFSYTCFSLLINCLFCSKCRRLRTSLCDVGSAIHTISRDLASHDPRSDKLIVPGNGTHGIRDTYRDVGFHLCSTLGRMGDVLRVGFVDGGRGGGCLGDPFPVISSVGQPLQNTIIVMTDRI
jgi:hypothetical protein